MAPFALDASLWDEPTTGIGLYVRCLWNALVGAGAEVARVGAEHSGERPRDVASRTLFALGRLPQVLEELGASLYHAVGNFNLPLVRPPGVRFVLTVHDLIPLLLPHTVSAAYRLQFRLWLSRSVQLADQVICVSQRTRADLLARFPGLDEGKVGVVHHGVDHVSLEPPDRTTTAYLDALGLPPDFVLYAGSLDLRKNVALLLDACELLRAQGRSPTVVLCGQSWFGSGPLERRVAHLRAQGFDLRPVGYLDERAYYGLMRRAGVFVFPSRYEGFGLPPLEAMRLGVPVVATGEGALAEVCGQAAWRVGPDDKEALAQALSTLLPDQARREAWADKGRRHAASFTWRRAADATLEVYAKALARAPSREPREARAAS